MKIELKDELLPEYAKKVAEKLHSMSDGVFIIEVESLRAPENARLWNNEDSHVSRLKAVIEYEFTIRCQLRNLKNANLMNRMAKLEGT